MGTCSVSTAEAPFCQSDEISVGNRNFQCSRFIERDENLCVLSDPRWFRIFPRVSLLLLREIQKLARQLTEDVDPIRVGVYVAGETSPLDQKLLSAAASRPRNRRFLDVANIFPPKLPMKCSQGFKSAQISLALRATGPSLTFNHSLWATIHALWQAESDLLDGTVDRAWVGSAFATDETFLMRIYDRATVSSHFIEGAGALLLTRTVLDDCGPLRCRMLQNTEWNYGIASPLVHALQRA